MPAAKKKTKTVKETTPAETEAQEVSTPTEEETQPLFQRNVETGLIDGYPYAYDELGRISWKEMIDPKYIIPNKDRLADRDVDSSKLTPEEIANLSDEDTIVLLQGFKNLLDIRGYLSFKESASYSACSKVEKAVATLEIVWLPNREEGRAITVTTTGEAHYHNTVSFGQQYLIRMACNRALVANIKTSLRIPILGYDELGVSNGSKKSKPAGLAKAVEDLCREKGYTYEKLKPRILENFDETGDCNSFQDLEDHWTNPKVLEFVFEKMKDA